MASKMRPLKQKCTVKSARNSVKNATPRDRGPPPRTAGRACSVFSELLKLGRKELGTSQRKAFGVPMFRSNRQWVDLDVWEGRRGHPDARAESMISLSLESISAAERTSFLPWVDLGV